MINLTKGSSPVTLSKASRLGVKIMWPATTDYDAGCEILYKDGTTESIATFGARGVAALWRSRNNTVRHSGDIGRGGEVTAQEIVEIDPDDEIVEITPWAYSAQSNGTGSFRRHAVSMEVSDGTNTVRIDASNASSHDNIYTCVPGIIRFTSEGAEVEYAELYSDPRSEARPCYKKGGVFGKMRFTLDGPRNNYK
jgi:hypothetical protein